MEPQTWQRHGCGDITGQRHGARMIGGFAARVKTLSASSEPCASDRSITACRWKRKQALLCCGDLGRIHEVEGECGKVGLVSNSRRFPTPKFHAKRPLLAVVLRAAVASKRNSFLS